MNARTDDVITFVGKATLASAARSRIQQGASLVTLPEATPVHEAMQLRADLGRAGIQPFAWVVNQSLAPLEVSRPLLHARQSDEHRFIEEARRETERFAIAPWLTQEPTGAEGLRHLTADFIAAASEES